MQADKPDAIILTGDLSYADDYNADDRFGYQPRWDIWGRFTQFLFANIPLIPTIGVFPALHGVGGDDTVCNIAAHEYKNVCLQGTPLISVETSTYLLLQQ